MVLVPSGADGNFPQKSARVNANENSFRRFVRGSRHSVLDAHLNEVRGSVLFEI